MTDLTDALKQAQKYASGERRLARWRDAYIETINTRHGEKLRALRAQLSPEAAAIVVAVEQQTVRLATKVYSGDPPPFDSASNGDGAPDISPRLLENPPEQPRPIEGQADRKVRK